MARTYFLHGFTVVGVISNPANSTLSSANLNLSGLTPWLPHVSSQCAACRKLSWMLSDHRRVSSIHFVLSGIEEVISSYLRV